MGGSPSSWMMSCLPRKRASSKCEGRFRRLLKEGKRLMLHAYQERSSLRGLTRTFGVSRTTVSSWIKKK